ncbi:hypothetical protein SPONN_2334 [uncultured Candidatus Thioglobus sp.]|nr:hypothetical protein SPONN_2334 [uncultured Candidatus Thioglobus sp.]
MALAQTKLFDEIDRLPIDLKTQLVDNILNSISPVNQSIDDLWITEVNRRKNEIESGVNLINGNAVFKKISQRLNS